MVLWLLIAGGKPNPWDWIVLLTSGMVALAVMGRLAIEIYPSAMLVLPWAAMST